MIKNKLKFWRTLRTIFATIIFTSIAIIATLLYSELYAFIIMFINLILLIFIAIISIIIYDLKQKDTPENIIKHLQEHSFDYEVNKIKHLGDQGSAYLKYWRILNG